MILVEWLETAVATESYQKDWRRSSQKKIQRLSSSRVACLHNDSPSPADAAPPSLSLSLDEQRQNRVQYSETIAHTKEEEERPSCFRMTQTVMRETVSRRQEEEEMFKQKSRFFTCVEKTRNVCFQSLFFLLLLLNLCLCARRKRFLFLSDRCMHSLSSRIGEPSSFSSSFFSL